MADQNQTEPTNPAGTGGATEAPAATQEPNGSGAATESGEKSVSLSEKEYKDLIAQRDRANEQAKNAESRNSQTDEWVAEQAMRQGVDSFLQKHQADFPDVKIDDLLWIPEEHLEEAAKQQQSRIEDAVQTRLAAVQNVAPPQETPEQLAAREQKLKSSPDKSSFGKMLRGRAAQRS